MRRGDMYRNKTKNTKKQQQEGMEKHQQIYINIFIMVI